jgi:hypothetical protein
VQTLAGRDERDRVGRAGEPVLDRVLGRQHGRVGGEVGVARVGEPHPDHRDGQRPEGADGRHECRDRMPRDHARECRPDAAGSGAVPGCEPSAQQPSTIDAVAEQREHGRQDGHGSGYGDQDDDDRCEGDRGEDREP